MSEQALQAAEERIARNWAEANDELETSAGTRPKLSTRSGVTTGYTTTLPTAFYGWSFTVASDVVVKSLGRREIGSTDQKHIMRIWDSAAPTVPLADVEISSDSPLADGNRIERLSSPITLSSGNTYIIASLEKQNGDQHITDAGTASTVDSRITITESISSDPLTPLAMPTVSGTASKTFGDLIMIEDAVETMATEATIDWAGSNYQKTTLTGNAELAATGTPRAGEEYLVEVDEASFALTLPAGWTGGASFSSPAYNPFVVRLVILADGTPRFAGIA